MVSDTFNVTLYSNTTCVVRPFFVAEGVVSDDRFYCISILIKTKDIVIESE